MVTKEQFRAFEGVRQSGLTNMFDVKQVISLAETMFNEKLTRDNCLEITKNYTELKQEYLNE